MIFSYDDIRHLHVEATTRCNAACPMCARNSCGATAPGLPLVDMSEEDFARAVPDDLLAQVQGIDFCGAYGDPAIAPELLHIIARIRRLSAHCQIVIYSNGGVRDAAWWRALAEALGESGLVIFALDGIGEINALHRRGVRFDKVMENVRAFIGAGGRARWEFLAFRHNEHQLDEAQALSRQMGFAEFSVKKTGRFLEAAYDYLPEYADHDDLNRFPVFDRPGQTDFYLEPPLNAELVNESVSSYRALIERFGSLDALFDVTEIDCRVADTKSVFLSAQGHAYPCCWTYVQATRPRYNDFPADADWQVVHLVERLGGEACLDAKARPLRDIVEGAFFGEISASWGCGAVSEGKLRVCARACGKNFPAYFNQFADEEKLPAGLKPAPVGV